jgi:amidophosphoribosyltransferase
MTNTKLIGARDPLGIRPLVIGELDGKFDLSPPKPVALDIIGARFVREVENGEVVVICDEKGDRPSIKPFPARRKRPCLFEYVYFARPDSIVAGKNVYGLRKQIGAILAQEAPVEADVVVPVPDSGGPRRSATRRQSGIPFELGIIRNHYVGRTFIEPTQSIRAFGRRSSTRPTAPRSRASAWC